MLTAIPVIAIDGPAASGKGVVSARLAEALGFHCLDSGGLYRAVALFALRQGGGAATTGGGLAEVALGLGEGRVLDDLLADPELSAPEVGGKASEIAALPEVRAALLPLQQGFRRAPGLVADGRDMATVVFPDAVLKVFLTAKLEVRAKRRVLQLQEKGIGATIDVVRAELRARDRRDQERKHAALARDPQAHVVESDSLAPDEIVRLLREKFHAAHFCPDNRAPVDGGAQEPRT